MESDFQLGTSRQARQAKKKGAIKNSLRLHTCGSLAVFAEAV